MKIVLSQSYYQTCFLILNTIIIQNFLNRYQNFFILNIKSFNNLDLKLLHVKDYYHAK